MKGLPVPPSDVQCTAHALCRQQQRSIPPAVLEALWVYGDAAAAGSGTERLYFTNRSWRRFAADARDQIKAFERYRCCYFILSADGKVITVGRRHKRINRKPRSYWRWP